NPESRTPNPESQIPNPESRLDRRIVAVYHRFTIAPVFLPRSFGLALAALLWALTLGSAGQGPGFVASIAAADPGNIASALEPRGSPMVLAAGVALALLAVAFDGKAYGAKARGASRASRTSTCSASRAVLIRGTGMVFKGGAHGRRTM